MIISDFLKQGKVTITEAADRLRVSRTTLSKIINGKSSLTPKIAKRFEAVFGLSAQKLLEEQAGQIAQKQIDSPVSSICQSNPILALLPLISKSGPKKLIPENAFLNSSVF